MEKYCIGRWSGEDPHMTVIFFLMAAHFTEPECVPGGSDICRIMKQEVPCSTSLPNSPSMSDMNKNKMSAPSRTQICIKIPLLRQTFVSTKLLSYCYKCKGVTTRGWNVWEVVGSRWRLTAMSLSLPR